MSRNPRAAFKRHIIMIIYCAIIFHLQTSFRPAPASSHSPIVRLEVRSFPKISSDNNAHHIAIPHLWQYIWHLFAPDRGGGSIYLACIDFQPLTAFLGEDFMARLNSRLGCDGIGDQVSTFGSLRMSGSQTDLSVLPGITIFEVTASQTV